MAEDSSHAEQIKMTEYKALMISRDVLTDAVK
jgi:hypothetical protein